MRMSAQAWVRTGIGCFIGIDVSKKSLDVCLWKAAGKPSHRRFVNSSSGFRELTSWCESQAALSSCHFCLESTGTYGLGIASFLADSKLLVSVENPRFIKHFAIGAKIQNKTDKTDALAIARYCQERAPGPWTLGDPALRELDLLLKRLSDLDALERRESNRLECSYLPESVRTSIQRVVKGLQDETQLIQGELETRIQGMPLLLGMVRALVREHAVGELTALRILAHMGFDPRTFQSAQQAAAAAGLNPVKRESGKTKQATHISKHGDPAFRAQLHMVAVVATKYNPRVKAFYEKRLESGMSKLAAVTACARKLLMICYGILKAHLRGEEPTYSGPKSRYINLRGKQRRLEPNP